MSNRENLKRYRERKEREGYQRVEILLSKEGYDKPWTLTRPSETWGETVERLTDVTGPQLRSDA